MSAFAGLAAAVPTTLLWSPNRWDGIDFHAQGQPCCVRVVREDGDVRVLRLAGTTAEVLTYEARLSLDAPSSVIAAVVRAMLDEAVPA